MLDDLCFCEGTPKINLESLQSNNSTSKLSADKLQLFTRRLAEGYDLDIDPEYSAWKASQLSAPDSLHLHTTSTSSAAAAAASSSAPDSPVGLTVSYDMGWAKRGRAMNSLTGVGANVGSKTGKVVGYSTRNKRCITCSVAARQKRDPKPHDCRKNHYGSSKSMEPAVAVDLAKSTESCNARIACIVADDDASTLKKLQDEYGNVQKQSDIGHCKRSLGAKLRDAKARSKQCKQLTTTVIQYVEKMFSYALQNNKGEPDSLCKTLLAIVPHAFGDHTNCNPSWCGYLKDATAYKHSSLPYGKDLTCNHTRQVLDDLFAGLAAQADRLAPLGSSQVNESLNNTVCSKAPKSRCYGGSESQDFRTAAAVLQKNEGPTYLSAVMDKAGLSPSSYSQKLGEYRAKKEAARKAVAKSKDGKLQRRKLRMTRSSQQDVSELREGVTYSSGCSLGVSQLDTDAIPAPLTMPVAEKLLPHPSRLHVCFDLETTSLLRTAQLTQIAAQTLDGKSKFSQYLLPTEPISSAASTVTGISVQARAGKPELAVNGHAVESVSQQDGIKAFVTWLESLEQSVILVAHNCFSFDMKVLMNALERVGVMADFLDAVHGFSDSLAAVKHTWPGETSYKLGDLFTSKCGGEFKAHDASEDVVALAAILNTSRCDVSSIALSASSVRLAIGAEHAMKVRQTSFNHLVQAKVLSQAIATKAAASGLSYEHLSLAFRRDELKGIERLFKEKTSSGRRVTAVNRIISAVTKHFKEAKN